MILTLLSLDRCRVSPLCLASMPLLAMLILTAQMKLVRWERKIWNDKARLASWGPSSACLLPVTCLNDSDHLKTWNLLSSVLLFSYLKCQCSKLLNCWAQLPRQFTEQILIIFLVWISATVNIEGKSSHPIILWPFLQISSSDSEQKETWKLFSFVNLQDKVPELGTGCTISKSNCWQCWSLVCKSRNPQQTQWW